MHINQNVNGCWVVSNYIDVVFKVRNTMHFESLCFCKVSQIVEII